MRNIPSKSIDASSRALRIGVALLAATAATLAAADDAKLLAKPEVESLVVGKTLKYVRASDGSTVSFDIKSDGKVYYSPQRTARNLSIQGSYTVGDDGTLCFKWESDKYVSMQDGCYKFRKDGTKTQVVGGRNPDRVIGDVVE